MGHGASPLTSAEPKHASSESESLTTMEDALLKGVAARAAAHAEGKSLVAIKAAGAAASADVDAGGDDVVLDVMQKKPAAAKTPKAKAKGKAAPPMSVAKVKAKAKAKGKAKAAAKAVAMPVVKGKKLLLGC